MFSEWLKANDLKRCLKPLHEYAPHPTAQDRPAWDGYPAEIRASAIAAAEKYLDYEWPLVRATSFMNFYRTGDRSVSTSQHMARRVALRDLVLGECFEHKGRFIDQIIDGIWLICEESFWGLSAHNGVNADEEMLPNVQNRYIDLFAGETATLLALTRYLLRDELDAVTPMVNQRIELELRERILLPYLEHRDFWWMGYIPGRQVNNWTPWITSNMLAVFLLVEPDDDLRRRCVKKACFSLDRFLASYGPDGGCDEGAHYWTKAGASLFDCLDLLHYATDGQLDFFGEPLIRNIGRYICHCHIAGPYYVNYADAAPIMSELNYSLIYRYGKAVGDESMMRLGARYLVPYERELNIPLMRILPAIRCDAEIRAYDASEDVERDVWLPDLQLAIARARADENSLFMSAKGGNNGESHNHNDVGSCIVFDHGQAALIDLGVETYSRKTFSPERYTIWSMRSDFHNTPDINGCVQLPGTSAAAKNAAFDACDAYARFSLDISGAYPAESGATEYTREYVLNRAEGSPAEIVITDKFAFERDNNEVTLNFIAWHEPKAQSDGSLLIQFTDGGALRMSCDSASPTVERYEFHDARMSQAWTDGVVHRIRYALKCGRVGSATVRLLEI